MSSYALFLLIVAYIQSKGPNFPFQNLSHSHMLLEFFQTYSQLETDKYAIRINTQGKAEVNLYPIDYTKIQQLQYNIYN